jgi:hypothetical protein
MIGASWRATHSLIDANSAIVPACSISSIKALIHAFRRINRLGCLNETDIIYIKDWSIVAVVHWCIGCDVGRACVCIAGLVWSCVNIGCISYISVSGNIATATDITRTTATSTIRGITNLTCSSSSTIESLISRCACRIRSCITTRCRLCAIWLSRICSSGGCGGISHSCVYLRCRVIISFSGQIRTCLIGRGSLRCSICSSCLIINCCVRRGCSTVISSHIAGCCCFILRGCSVGINCGVCCIGRRSLLSKGEIAEETRANYEK